MSDRSVEGKECLQTLPGGMQNLIGGFAFRPTLKDI